MSSVLRPTKGRPNCGSALSFSRTAVWGRLTTASVPIQQSSLCGNIIFVECMFFGGGMPFGMGMGQEDEEETDLYEVLGVDRNCSKEALEKKYAELTELYGPEGEDNDPEKLEEIDEAFGVLINPQSRKAYDATIPSGEKQKPKGPPVKQLLEVPLASISEGGELTLKVERARICGGCAGTGGEGVKKCSGCNGQGATIGVVQMGPGMYQQIRRKCEECQGMGEIFPEGSRCKVCQGRKIEKKEAQIAVTIPKGMPTGHVLTVEGEGHEEPGKRPGDLYVTTQEKIHQLFTRKGADLFVKHTISLPQALLGFNFSLQLLDGSQKTVFTGAGEVVGDHDKRILRGLGLPFFGDEELRGHIVIEFKVEMPKRGQLTPQQLQALIATLPGTVNPRPKDEHYEMLGDFDREQVNSSEEGGKKKDEEEEEGEEGGIGCQAQ